ncbi:solute carrier family 27 member 4-like protein [Dinothrombium tinctorium]|uniref:Long-chain-fatty-acid--CoA ligase n=1 Tax=Dinothrombium tinctorium TaxID=1965070 RepID=A0A3S3SJS8_9ACAR|nr:solute carrier family 27 member 4-like protein [Dinothrombium tinctorium]
MVILGALVENIPLEGLVANPYVKAIVRNVMFAAGFYITTRGYVFTRMAYYTLGRDLKALTRLLRTKYYMNKFRKQELSVAKAFKQMVKKHPNKVAFYFEDEEWTFKELDIFSNKVANLILDSGISAGDEVSLFMESKPEYVGIWLGLAKIGVISALINTNQKQDTLIHSISTVNSKALIYGSELQKSVNDVFLTLHQKLNLQFFCFGAHKMNTSPLIKDMKKLVRESSDKEPSQIANGKFSDHLFYIFTSGTTGLPKAVIIKNSRYLFMSTVVKMMLGVRDDDVLYTCIPLYHMAGGAIGTGNCLVHGTSMAIRHKFSASKFWSDCIKYNCTLNMWVNYADIYSHNHRIN